MTTAHMDFQSSRVKAQINLKYSRVKIYRPSIQQS